MAQEGGEPWRAGTAPKPAQSGSARRERTRVVVAQIEGSLRPQAAQHRARCTRSTACLGAASISGCRSRGAGRPLLLDRSIWSSSREEPVRRDTLCYVLYRRRTPWDTTAPTRAAAALGATHLSNQAMKPMPRISPSAFFLREDVIYLLLGLSCKREAVPVGCVAPANAHGSSERTLNERPSPAASTTARPATGAQTLQSRESMRPDETSLLILVLYFTGTRT